MKLFKCRVNSKTVDFKNIYAIVVAKSVKRAEAIITKRIMSNTDEDEEPIDFKVEAILIRNGNDLRERIIVVIDDEYKNYEEED